MKKLTFKSIKSRLMFWFLFIAITLLTVALIVTYIQKVKVIEGITFSKLTAIRDLKVETLNHWLNERSSDMKAISADEEMIDLKRP